MRKEQYRADMLYQVSLSVAKTMREQGLITADEYVEIDTMLLAKYQPYLGVFYRKTLDKSASQSNI